MIQKSSAMSSAGFVHLHVHSAYSLLKGSIKIQKLGELAKADRQPALALTDTDNMFGRSISATRTPMPAMRWRVRRGSCCWRRARPATAI
jgi:hypothetical protein